MEKVEVAIIGGGAVGLSIAYHLTRAGVRGIALFERGLLGEGATGACMGGVRLDFSTEVNVRFSLESFRRWEHFEEEFGINPRFERVGYLMVASDEAAWAALRANRSLHARLGVLTELLPPQEVKARWPFLFTEDLRGASFCAADGVLSPQEVVQGFARRARELGAEIRQGVEVRGLRLEGDRVRGLETTEGPVEAPVVVNAAGPWAREVGRMAGLEVPVDPIRRQVFVSGPVPALPSPIPLIIDLGQHTTYKSEGEGYILYGPQDRTPSFNTRVEWEGRVWAVERARTRIPALGEARIVRGWAGLYEISPDNHAILGRAPGVEGLYLANGFSGHGFQHSPAAGKVLAELILEGEARTLNISPLSPERFARGETLRETLTTHHAEAM